MTEATHDTPTAQEPFDTPPPDGAERESSEMRGPRNLMIALLCIGLAGTCFLISAGSGTEPGHRPWKPTSILRHVTTLLNLSGEYPTPRGTEVKWLVQGLTASAALAAAGYAFWMRTRREEDFDDNLTDPDEAREPGAETSLRERLSRIPLVTAAQIAMGVFVAFMALSSLWAPWTEASFADTMIRASAVVWAICLGCVLSPRKTIAATLALVIILALMSALGVWYFFERAPQQRLKFPIGNPIFLAAILLPGLIMAIAVLAAVFASRSEKQKASPTTRSDALTTWHPAVLIIGGLVALLVIGWAIFLAESRGPAVGLAGALFVCLLLIVPRSMRLRVLGSAMILVAVIWMTHMWPMSWLDSRPTTVRLRMYAWNYAWDLFTSRPDIGHGQGSYVLMAQAPSRTDALHDPQAFTAELLGHTHNEWLEVLADLGAIGFALIATSLALTFYAAVVTMHRHPKYSAQWWITLGLVGSLTALIVEECFNVGLRMPGLPFVFHTVLGLLWAASRTDDDASPPHTMTPLLRVGTTTLLSLGAVAMLMVSVANWRAARAEYQLAETIEHQRWDHVIEVSERAMGMRWSIEERMRACERVAAAYHLTARHHAFQLLNLLERQNEANPEEAVRLQEIAQEDLLLFAYYTDSEKNLIRFMLEIMPRYPDVAWLAADTSILQQDVVNARSVLLENPPQLDFISEAAQWLELELDSNRYDPEVALRLVQLAPQATMQQRLDWMRVPLRVTTLTPGYEGVLGLLMRQPDFGPTLNALLQVARATTQPAGTTPLPRDAFAPETLRLSSAALKLSGRFEDAARMAGFALDLYAPLRDRFPDAIALTRLEQARCLFLASPQDPSAAIETCREGLKESDPLQDATRIALRRALALYLTAADQEAEARRSLLEEDPQLTEQDIAFEIARAYVELSSLVMGLPPERQPDTLNTWIERAVASAPDWAPPHQLAFNRAIDLGDTDKALHHFESLRQIMIDPQLWSEWKRAIETRFRDNLTLQDVFTRAPSTQPAAPATQTAAPPTRPASHDDIEPLLPAPQSPLPDSSGPSTNGENTPLRIP